MTTNRVTTYSADENTLSIAGIPLDSGFADGEFVSIEMAADDFTVKVGADGEVARAKTNNRTATIKIKLLQTSQGNNALSALRQLAIDSVNGADVGSFLLNDRSSGTMKARADKAWISKPPTISRGREVAEYEWTLMASHMELTIDGNPAV